jgi:hypothetical protein
VVTSFSVYSTVVRQQRARPRGEVAAPFGPFVGLLVGLLGQYGADEADDDVADEENAEGVGAAPNLPVEPLLRVVGPDLGPRPWGWS